MVAASRPKTVVASIQCHCGGTSEVEMTVEEMLEWKAREKRIQDIFPDMTSEQRETLMTGMCVKCQAVFFKPPPEDEED